MNQKSGDTNDWMQAMNYPPARDRDAISVAAFLPTLHQEQGGQGLDGRRALGSLLQWERTLLETFGAASSIMRAAMACALLPKRHGCAATYLAT
jgi:hypothetical protein